MVIARSGLLILLAFSGCMTGFPEAPNSLPLLLHQRVPGTFTLQEEWSGVVSIVSIGGALEHDPQINPPRKVRVDTINIGENEVWIGRTVSYRFWAKGFTMDYQLMQNLPNPGELIEITELAVLTDKLGKSNSRSLSGFTAGQTLHTSTGWRFFSLESEEKVSVIEILAFISKHQDADAWQITDIMVSEGSLIHRTNKAR